MDNMIINHWAVLVCAVVSLLVGALWYSPLLFFRAWKRENNLSEEQLQRFKPGKVYTITFFLALLISYNLAFFLGDDKTNWSWGLTAGFLAGFGWAATMFAIIALFEQKTWKYILINAGYIVVYFSIIGFILGAWR